MSHASILCAVPEYWRRAYGGPPNFGRIPPAGPAGSGRPDETLVPLPTLITAVGLLTATLSPFTYLSLAATAVPEPEQDQDQSAR